MIFAFEVGMRGDTRRSTINSISAGKARAEFLRRIQDYLPHAKFIEVSGRKLGPAQSSEGFLRTAQYRGLPDLRCGDAVSVRGLKGFVVGHNESANFNVLFVEGAGSGRVLNCHPNDFDKTKA